MVTQALREKTSVFHDTIEQVTNSKKIFEGTFSTEDYKNLLHINGHIVNGFIDSIFNTLPEDIKSQLKFSSADKKQAIAKDAEELTLNIDVENIELKENNPAYALGALYVMEGSMLGGNVIAKTLRKNDNFTDHQFNYFTFHKDALGANWKEFLGTLTSSVQSESEIDSCVKGATQVYEELIAKAKTLFN